MTPDQAETVFWIGVGLIAALLAALFWLRWDDVRRIK